MNHEVVGKKEKCGKSPSLPRFRCVLAVFLLSVHSTWCKQSETKSWKGSRKGMNSAWRRWVGHTCLAVWCAGFGGPACSHPKFLSFSSQNKLHLKPEIWSGLKDDCFQDFCLFSKLKVVTSLRVQDSCRSVLFRVPWPNVSRRSTIQAVIHVSLLPTNLAYPHRLVHSTNLPSRQT